MNGIKREQSLESLTSSVKRRKYRWIRASCHHSQLSTRRIVPVVYRSVVTNLARFRSLGTRQLRGACNFVFNLCPVIACNLVSRALGVLLGSSRKCVRNSTVVGSRKIDFSPQKSHSFSPRESYKFSPRESYRFAAPFLIFRCIHFALRYSFHSFHLFPLYYIPDIPSNRPSRKNESNSCPLSINQRIPEFALIKASSQSGFLSLLSIVLTTESGKSPVNRLIAVASGVTAQPAIGRLELAPWKAGQA